MRPGDVFALNDPYNGGTHLPDITVITPVFLTDGPAPAFFVAARGHHADIGGITPGSMPPDSTHVDEEGVLIDNVLLVPSGRFREAEMRALLGGGPLPGAQPRPEPRRPAGADRRLRQGRARSSARWSRTSALPVVARLHAATCRTTPRRRCAACSTR